MLGYIEAHDAHAKRIFGPGAVLAGSIGSEAGPGRMAIYLDGQRIGSGPDFQAALVNATRTMAATQRTARPVRLPTIQT